MQLGGLDHVRQPVGAEQQIIARAPFHGGQFHFGGNLIPQAACHHVAKAKMGSFLCGELPRLQHLGNQRVVLGQLPDRPVMHQVRAAVADMGEVNGAAPAEGQD